MRSDDDKIQSQSGSPTDDQTRGWTPADSPEEDWTRRSADADPWSSPLAAPEEPPLSQPAAEPMKRFSKSRRTIWNRRLRRSTRFLKK